MNTYITVITIVVALFMMLISIWGLGKAEESGDKSGKEVAGSFYGVGLVVFIVGLVLAIKMPSISSHCV